MVERASSTAGKWVNASVIGAEAARATWALAARERLVEVAGSYHATITLKELADFVQERSLVRTGQLYMHWIGDVLTRVSRDCVERGEPLLTALAVDARGRVGPGYTIVVEDQARAPLDQPDEHAAEERLACYRWFGAELPAGGGVPAFPEPAQPPERPAAPRKRSSPVREPAGSGAVAAARAAAPSRARKSRVTAPAAPLRTCPVHFTVLPASGVCDYCE